MVQQIILLSQHKKLLKTNKMMITKNKFFAIILVVVGFVLFYGIYSSISKKRMLEEKSIISEAVITSKYRIRSRGYYVNYEFYIDNKKYKGSQKLMKKDLIIEEGDKFLVEFVKENPDYNKINLNKKIEND
jgi:hypothetical protein